MFAFIEAFFNLFIILPTIIWWHCRLHFEQYDKPNNLLSQWWTAFCYLKNVNVTHITKHPTPTISTVASVTPFMLDLLYIKTKIMVHSLNSTLHYVSSHNIWHCCHTTKSPHFRRYINLPHTYTSEIIPFSLSMWVNFVGHNDERFSKHLT